MRLKGTFWLLSALLLVILALLSYRVAFHDSRQLFFLLEGLIVGTAIYLVYLYRRVIKPLHTIGNGMELLREQDFSSRLGKVGQAEADKVVDLFNKMMEQLKNERLHLQEQNYFLDLLINASPMGVIILDLDNRIQSLNAATYQLLTLPDTTPLTGLELVAIDHPLIRELQQIPVYETATIRLSDSNIYKCTHASFIDRGFQHAFYLIESLTQEVVKAEKRAYEQVIRMIAHEVNNTTAGITSTLDTLEQAFRERAELEEECDLLRLSIERCYGMSRFITNFADVVRIPEAEPTRQDLNRLVTSSKQFMETICRNRQIRILLELTEKPLPVDIDYSLFEQVLVNIIKNSAESIGSEGIITIRTDDAPVVIEVIDNGKGINQSTESKLFTPFFSTKPNGQGIGLLFIREVLQQHHCTFSLRTGPDGLTRFRIQFGQQFNR
ncbi:PAS domain-containing protein [Parabacteroides sp. OttesenSCG-928-N08]|nr:PAS domain-containing protein [Parabacteroides sp. OttesenSCG-928-N08]